MKNREHLYQSGEPVDPEIVGEFEEIERKKSADIFRNSPKMEETLRRVNFDILREVFARYAKKVGMDKKDINVLNARSINSETSGGAYRVARNLIGLSSEGIEERYAGFKWDLAVLKVLVHEETHAVSGARCMGISYFEKLKRKETGRVLKKDDVFHQEDQTGYTQGVIKVLWRELPVDSRILFMYFNEGVVEKLSREVLSQYLKEDLDFVSKEEAKKFIQKYKENPVSYKSEVELVDALVNRIAK